MRISSHFRSKSPFQGLCSIHFFCGGKRTRTADICLAKAALYQLSYTPWAILDSNQGPHPYQGCALTNWANSPSSIFRPLKVLEPTKPEWWTHETKDSVPKSVMLLATFWLKTSFSEFTWFFDRMNRTRKACFERLFKSFLRRCSSHTFQYGYLVTTSPQSLTLP